MTDLLIDIKGLTNEEVVEWCGAVTHRAIKKCFLDNSREYSKLPFRTNVQVKKLTEQDIEKIIMQNRSSEFISTTLNYLSNKIVEAVKDNISKSIENGTDATWAACEVLSDSPFKDKIDLYFKSSQTDADNAILIKNITNLMKQTTGFAELENQNHELRSQKKDYEKNTAELKIIISERETRISTFKGMLEDETNSKKRLEKSVSDLMVKLEHSQKENDELKAEKEIHVESMQNFQYSKNPDYMYTSVCKVKYNSYQYENMLYRLADIDTNGEIKAIPSNFPVKAAKTSRIDD